MSKDPAGEAEAVPKTCLAEGRIGRGTARDKEAQVQEAW